MPGAVSSSLRRSAALAAVLLFLAQSANAVEQVRAVDAQGLAMRLAGARGKVVILNFWATWCEPCREEFPDLVRYAREHQGKLLLMTVSLDTPGEADGSVREFLAAMKTPGVKMIKAPGDPDPFINSVDPSWSGALPATFIHDSTGARMHAVHGPVTYQSLGEMAGPLLEQE